MNRNYTQSDNDCTGAAAILFSSNVAKVANNFSSCDVYEPSESIAMMRMTG